MAIALDCPYPSHLRRAAEWGARSRRLASWGKGGVPQLRPVHNALTACSSTRLHRSPKRRRAKQRGGRKRPPRKFWK